MLYQELEAIFLREAPRSKPTQIVSAINRTIRDINLRVGGFYSTQKAIVFNPPANPGVTENYTWYPTANELQIPQSFYEVAKVIYVGESGCIELKNADVRAYCQDKLTSPAYHYLGNRRYQIADYISARAGEIKFEGFRFCETLSEIAGDEIVYDTEIYFNTAWEELLIRGTLAKLLFGTEQGKQNDYDYNEGVKLLNINERTNAPSQEPGGLTYEYRTMRGR